MARRRLLLITQIYRPDPAAAGQYLTDVAEEMARRGMDVTVIAADRGYDDPSVRYARRETIAGVNVIRVPFSSFGKQSIAGRVVGGLLFVLQSAIRALFMRRFDGILVSTVPPMVPLAALILHAVRRIPIVYWVMDVNPDQIVALGFAQPTDIAVRALDWMNRATLRAARAVIVLDRHMAERMQRKLDISSKVKVLPPWSRDAYLEPVDHEDNPFRVQHELNGRFVVMYSGNHGPSAPLETLFSAIERLHDDKRFAFVFAGGGVEKHKVDAVAAANPNVINLPYQPLEALRYSLSAADVHIVSTGDAMVGIVHQCKVYGAFAVARPVLLLGPEQSAIGEIVARNPVGWRVDHGDVDGLVALLRVLLAARDGDVHDRGARAKELSQKSYGMEKLRNELCDFVQKSLVGSGPAIS